MSSARDTQSARSSTVRKMLGAATAAVVALSGLVISPTAAHAAEVELSGTVSGPSDAQSVQVVLYTVTAYSEPEEAREYFGEWPAAPNGDWSVSVPAGHYVVAFQDPTHRFRSEFFDGVTADDLYSPAITVVDATTMSVPDLDATLEPNPVVSGTVTGIDDLDVGTVYIARDAGNGDWNFFSSTRTAANGDWHASVPSGDYRFEYSRFDTVTQAYDGVYGADLLDEESAATSVPVSDDVYDIDFDVQLRPSVLGTVVDGDGAPLAEVTVNVWAWSSGAWYKHHSMTTDAGGAFDDRLSSAFGSALAFSFEGYGMDTAYSGGGTDLPAQPGDPGTYRYELDDIDLGSVTVNEQPKSRLGGNVSGVDQLGDTEVTLWQDSSGTGMWEFVKSTFADEDGDWSVRVLDGTYRIEYRHPLAVPLFYHGAERVAIQDPSVDDVVVAGSDRTDLNDVLHERPVVTATIVDAETGDPIENAEFTSWEWTDYSDGWYPTSYDYSDAHGGVRSRQASYPFPYTSTYSIDAHGHALGDAYGDAYEPWFSSGSEGLPAGRHDVGTYEYDGTEIDLGTIELQRIPTSTVGGTVTNVDAPQYGHVTVYRWDAASEYWSYVDDYSPDESGQWSAQLVAGDYRFAYWNHYVVAQLYDGVDWGPDGIASPLATTVPVDGTTDIGTINFAPTPRPVATGVAIDETGGPVPGANVRLMRWDEFAEEWYEVRSEYAEEDGAFSITLDPGETEYLEISSFGYTTSYGLPEVTSPPATPASPGAFEVNEDLILGEVAMPSLPRQTVSGTITGDGELGSVEVSIYAIVDGGGWWETVASTSASFDGTWSIDLPAGTYRVQFFDYTGRFRTQVYDGIDTNDWPGEVENAQPVVVSDTAVPGVDADLTLVPAASGVVTDSAGEPLEGATVRLWYWDVYNWSWGSAGSDLTDANGQYRLTGEDSDTYAVTVDKFGYASASSAGGGELPTGRSAPGAFELSDSLELAPFTLTELPMHSAHGSVQPDAASASVDVYQRLRGEWQYATYVEVTENGEWTAQLPDGDYRFEFNAYGYHSQVFEGIDAGPDYAGWLIEHPDAMTVTVDGEDVAQSIDADLTPQPAISGTVSDAGGPVDAVAVSLFQWDGDGWHEDSASPMWTHGGSYEFIDIEPGSYTLYFDTSDATTTAPSVWLNGETDPPTDPGAHGVFTYTGDPVRLSVDYELEGDAHPASASGLVQLDGEPVAGAAVTVSSAGRTYSATTDTLGTWSLPAIAPGDYSVEVFPVSGAVGDTVLFTVPDTDDGDPAPSVIAPTIVLRAPVGIENSETVALQQEGGGWFTDGGVPVVYYGDDFDLVVTDQAPGSVGTYTVTLGGEVVRSGTLVEGPAGTFRATIAALMPLHGQGVVSWTITPPGDTPHTESFDVYIDPSGVVVDQYGTPVTGATVTALHSDTEAGDYTAIPSNDPLLSPSTPTNPQVTDANGRYAWNVAPGWYRVSVTAPDAAAVTTDAMQVPPERTELTIPIVVDGAQPPTPATAPQLSGMAMVGAELTVIDGIWAADIEIDGVEWIVDDTPVSTNDTYTPDVDDGGKPLVARLHGHREVFSHVDGVAPGDGGAVEMLEFPFTFDLDGGDVLFGTVVPGAVAITPGDNTLGSTYTAVPTGWAPGDLDFEYEWRRDGVPIADGDERTYALTEADFGSSLSVLVTGTAVDYVDASALSAALPIGLGTLTGSPAVTIDGQVRVGNEVSASVSGAWSPTATTHYTWLLGDAPIPGAENATYTIQPEDAGQLLRVRLTGTRLNYQTAVAQSAQQTVTLGEFQPGTVEITGGFTDVDSGTLTAATAGWPSGTDFTYVWSRAGEIVAGESDTTLELDIDDHDVTFTATVTGTRGGYESEQATSPALRLPEGVISLGVPDIDGVPLVGEELTLVEPNAEPSDATLAYEWLRDGEPTGVSTASYVLTVADIGAEMSVEATATRTGFSTEVVESEPTGTVQGVFTKTPTPKVKGTAKVGKTLKVDTGTWEPSGAKFAYQWKANGKSIKKATKSSYKITKGDKGKKVTVTVTARKTDYISVSVTSKATKKVK